MTPTVQSLNAGPTRWENLGDWSRARAYPEACRALALRLGRAARLGPGDVVLDVGCGWGEQLPVWRELGAARVVAVEPCPERAAVARARGAADVHALPGERLEELPADGVDVVLALDSAYHVDPDALLRGAARALRPGGRLAFSTLTGAPAAAPVRALRALAARACRLAPGALRAPDAWRSQLEAAGFRRVEVTPLSEPVLAGFARHAQRLRRAPRRVRVTAACCDLAHRTGWLGYALFEAERA